MPRLGSLLVCEKIILDQQGKPSLIALFQKITAVVPKGEEIPKQALAMTSWSVFCEWFMTEGDADKKFEQALEVVNPDETPSPIRNRLPLKEVVKGGQGTRVFVNIIGIPVAQEGFVTVNVWLESDSQRVSDIYSYRIQIEHTEQPPTQNDGGAIVQAAVPQPH